ncbi:Mitochondrial import inner membrane translocase subunit TIM50 [Diplonema papillatum]|nr:Mitochondrial import inner membrane translocase subunit TIM50 [Diplonema papillatum]
MPFSIHSTPSPYRQPVPKPAVRRNVGLGYARNGQASTATPGDRSTAQGFRSGVARASAGGAAAAQPPLAYAASGSDVVAGSGLAAARMNRIAPGAGTWPGAHGARRMKVPIASPTPSGPIHSITGGSSRAAGGTVYSGVQRSLIPKQAPEHAGKYTIVFDLDETLVCNRSPGFRPAFRRPHLENLLASLKGKAEVVLWTASIESVGKPVLRQIDPSGEFFHHAIYRNPAWFCERPMVPHTKDLKLLGRDVAKTIIVENNPFSVRLNKTSGVLLPDYDRANPNDRALIVLEKFLHALVDSGKPVQEFVSSSPNLVQMRLLKNFHCRIASVGNDPFYYLALNH